MNTQQSKGLGGRLLLVCLSGSGFLSSLVFPASSTPLPEVISPVVSSCYPTSAWSLSQSLMLVSAAVPLHTVVRLLGAIKGSKDPNQVPCLCLCTLCHGLDCSHTATKGLGLAVPSILLTLVTRKERGEEGADRDPGRWTPSLPCSQA